MPFRVNLLAVVCDSSTVALVYFTALRITDNRSASVCAALVLAFSPLFWSWSLVAEVFSLNNLIVAAIIFILVVRYEEPQRMGLLISAAFVSGLGLTNQQTIVPLGPAVLFLLWRRRQNLMPQPVILAATAFVLGLLPYAYLPWATARHPRWSWVKLRHLRIS